MSQNSPEPKRRKILVVDDREGMLIGTIKLLNEHYPQAEIATAKTVQDALRQLQESQPDLAIMDLALPETSGGEAKVEHGIKSLETLFKKYTTLNLSVQSSYVKSLVRVKSYIDTHEGGFTVADKGLSSQELLRRIDWAL